MTMKQTGASALLMAAAMIAAVAHAAPTPEELAKMAQNPVANLISVPLQNNTNFNVGPLSGTQNILNIQPVIPVSLNKDWNLITRTILPVITQPGFVPDQGSTTGLGDIQFSAFLSPANAAGLIWGAGAIVQAPTHSDSRLGNKHWGLGPTAVALHLHPGDPWVYGVLVNNVWSGGSGGSDPSYNNFLLQPFVNYNLPGGVYVNSVPIITANWKADGSQRWTVPLGAGIGKIFHFGPLPVNMQMGAYYNVVRPDNAADWQLRLQMMFMFPK
jgi:hypothetical protein